MSPAVPRYVVPEHVVFRTFVAETVILNLQTGLYHGLNPSAGRMLELLREHGDPGEVVRRFSGEVDAPEQTIADDLDAFCADLLSRGLIAEAAGEA